MRRFLAAVSALLVLGGCVQGAGDLTETGMGFPRLSAEIPETVATGENVVAKLTVENPGPGDMDSVMIAFAPIGPGQGETSIPVPLVGITAPDETNPSVVEVSPQPEGVGQGGVVYRFGALEEGDSLVISFTLKAPVVPGTAANSVQVYDGSDVSRARGVRLQTLVER